MTILKYFLLMLPLSLLAVEGQDLFDFPTETMVRNYYLAVPVDTPAEGATLVVGIHGVGSDGQNAYKNYDWKKYSDEYNFIYLAPNGFKKAWSNGLESKFLEKEEDDVAYISSLIKFIISKYKINPEKVYMVGYSGGAMMVYRFVSEISGLVKKAAVVSGSLEVEPTEKSKGLPLLQIHGKKDRLVSASNENGGFVGKTSAQASALKWSHVNNCQLEEFVEDSLTGEYPYEYLRKNCYPLSEDGNYMEYLEFKRYWHLAPFPTRRTVTDYIWKFFQTQH